MERQVHVAATSNRKLYACLRVLKHNLLLVLTLVGVGLGFGVGFAINPLRPSEDTKLWLGLPGEMFMRMLKMTILPLIITNVIAGSASLGPRSNGRIGLVALTYILLTNSLGTLLGVAVHYMINPAIFKDLPFEFIENSNDIRRSIRERLTAFEMHSYSIRGTFQPHFGKGFESLPSVNTQNPERQTHLQTRDIIADLIRNLFPENLVSACFEKTQTLYNKESIVSVINGTNVTVVTYVREIGTASGTNVTGLIIVCTLVGMAAPSVGEIGEIFVKFFEAASGIIIRVMCWLIWFTPVGVASLVAASIASVPNIGHVFSSVGMFFLSAAVSIAFLNFLIIPLLYLVFIRRNPVSFFLIALRPMMVAFAPPSSAVAIPEMLNVCETKFYVDRRVSGFVVPFGAALNRTGSASFIIMGAIFMCQLEQKELDLGIVLMMVLLTIIGTLALPAVPSGSIMMILIVLSGVNVHTTNIGLIIALEWITDRIRTTANTFSVTFGTILTHKFCQRALRQSDQDYSIDVIEIEDVKEYPEK